MKYKSLKEISRIKGGKRIPKGYSLSIEKTNHAYIRIVDMEHASRIEVNDNFQYVNEEVYSKIQRYTVNTDDIIISIVGTIGIISLIGDTLNGANLTENCVKVSVNKNKFIPEFIFNYLTSYIGQKQIKYGIVGSVQPKLPLYNIEKIQIPEIDIEEQKEIVRVINVFSELLNANKALITNLEEYSQLLFHKWFIDFNFPDKNGNPYKDSGGEMVAIDGKMIPKGWSINKFSELVSFKNGLNYSADNNKEPNSKIISVKQLVRNTILSEEIANRLFLPEGISEDYKINKYDTIIARSASPGESALALEDLNVYYSGFSIRIRPNQESWKYLTYFNTLLLKKMITSHSDSTIIKNVTQQSLSNFKIVTPTNDVIESFNSTIEPFLLKLYSLNKENQLLEETRDLLIKKLIK